MARWADLTHDIIIPMLPSAIPLPQQPAGPQMPGTGAAVTTPPAGTGTTSPVGPGVPDAPPTQSRTSVKIRFPASRDEVFRSFSAIANLADKSDGQKITIVIEAQCNAGYDRNWLRNAVQEPLDEANIDDLKIE